MVPIICNAPSLTLHASGKQSTERVLLLLLQEIVGQHSTASVHL